MWDKNKIKEVFKQFSTAAKYLIGVLLTVYLLLLAADLLFLKIIYERVYQLVYNTGGVSNVYLINALTMTVTLAAYLVIPIIVWSFVTLKKKHFALFLALAYCGGMLGLFILSRPAPDQLFNLLTGEPLYRYYRDPDNGRIELFPVDTLKHPRIGVPLEKLTSEVALEMDRRAKAEEKTKAESKARQKEEMMKRQKEEERQKMETAAAERERQKLEAEEKAKVAQEVEKKETPPLQLPPSAPTQERTVVAGSPPIQPSQKIEYLNIGLASLRYLSDGRFRATLLLTNQNEDGRGCAVALKALYSDGLADFWKFSPSSNATLTDNSGNVYKFQSSSGLGWRRTQDDWLILKAGQSAKATIDFSGRAQRGFGIGLRRPTQPDELFTLNFEIWLVYGNSTQKWTGAFNVQLDNINLTTR